MDSNEVNKILAGLLGTVFVVFSVGIVSDSLFAAPKPAKPGFTIEAAEPEAAGGGAKEVKAAKPVAELLAAGTADAGAAVFKKCQACHSGEKGGPNKVGPDLWDIVNRPVAHHEGFAYSAGMKDFAKGGDTKWSFENLNHFLTSPKGFVKGTAMGFAGLPKDEDRGNLLAYLRTLSDSPAALPEAGAAPAATPASDPADAKPAEAKPAQ